MQGKLVILLLLAAFYVASAKVVDVEVRHDCPANEEWQLCGKLCEPSCELRNRKLCPPIECSKFTSGCTCKSGYVRKFEGSGRCILKKDCSRE